MSKETYRDEDGNLYILEEDGKEKKWKKRNIDSDDWEDLSDNPLDDGDLEKIDSNIDFSNTKNKKEQNQLITQKRSETSYEEWSKTQPKAGNFEEFVNIIGDSFSAVGGTISDLWNIATLDFEDVSSDIIYDVGGGANRS